MGDLEKLADIPESKADLFKPEHAQFVSMFA
jgi:hypothetical protein